MIPTVCPDNACTPGKECKANPDQGGYMCVCPVGKTGQFCDEDEDYCFDSSCRRGLFYVKMDVLPEIFEYLSSFYYFLF